MATSLLEFWDALNAELIANSAQLGIASVEKGEAGKTTPVKVPGCLTFVMPTGGVPVHAGKILGLTVDVNVFCVAQAKGSSSEAISTALSLALAVLDHLAGKTVGGEYLSIDDNPIEVVDPSSNHAVVAATLNAILRT